MQRHRMSHKTQFCWKTPKIAAQTWRVGRTPSAHLYSHSMDSNVAHSLPKQHMLISFTAVGHTAAFVSRSEAVFRPVFLCQFFELLQRKKNVGSKCRDEQCVLLHRGDWCGSKHRLLYGLNAGLLLTSFFITDTHLIKAVTHGRLHMSECTSRRWTSRSVLIRSKGRPKYFWNQLK